MTATLLHQVITLVEKLTLEERQMLFSHFQNLSALSSTPTTRDGVMAEHQRRIAAGLFTNAEDLYGKYANPEQNEDLSFETLEAILHEHSWEEELDEFFSNNAD